MLVVSHDRWFLDAICTRVWEVHDGVVDSYDGGYAAYVLARAERARQAAGMAARRKNLLRKELAWLRRGAPARTSKPKFRIDAATTLIADEPPPRDRLELQRFSVSRLGKDVFDLGTSTWRRSAGEPAGAAVRPQLVHRPGRPDRPDRGERRGQDHPAPAAGGDLQPDRGQGQAGPDPGARPPAAGRDRA